MSVNNRCFNYLSSHRSLSKEAASTLPISLSRQTKRTPELDIFPTHLKKKVEIEIHRDKFLLNCDGDGEINRCELSEPADHDRLEGMWFVNMCKHLCNTVIRWLSSIQARKLRPLYLCKWSSLLPSRGRLTLSQPDHSYTASSNVELIANKW